MVEMGEGFTELADKPGFSESVLASCVAEASVGIDQIDLLRFKGTLGGNQAVIDELREGIGGGRGG